jgi:colicin import membrane protein
LPFGLIISIACHAALLLWAYGAMRSVHELPTPETPAISAELITPSEFLRLKQGAEDAKQLESKAKDKTSPDESKNDTKKPDNTPPPPPPPPQEEAKAEPPPPPEPPKPEPPKPDPIAEKIEKEPPPPPTPTPEPGPTPDEQKILDQKLEEERKAEEDKKKAAEEAKKKAAEEAKRKKLAEEAKKKKAAEEARKKAEAAKNKFDPNALANLIEKAPGDAQPKALIDKDPNKKGQQAAGTSATATATGKEAGTATGTDTVLSAREQDLLAGMIKSQLQGCWRLSGAGGGTEVPVVKLKWRLKTDGYLDGDPVVTSAPSDASGQVAAEAALRAVKECQPYRLPPDKYDAWKDIKWDFDPRQML